MKAIVLGRPGRLPLGVTVLLGVVALAAGVRTAYADTFGGDLPILLDMLANGMQQLRSANESLTTLRQSYDQTRRYVRYADDAYQTFQAFQRLNLTSLGRALDDAFPDAEYFRQEAGHPNSWTRGSGDLQARLRLCLRAMTNPLPPNVPVAAGRDPANSDACVEVRERLAARQVEKAVAETFGPTPIAPGAKETRAIDREVVTATQTAHAQEQRNKVARGHIAELAAFCQNGADPEACRTAADRAQLDQAELTTHINDQLAELNRLQALRLAQENARRKRELREASERHQLVIDSAGSIADPAPELRAPGFHLGE